MAAYPRSNVTEATTVIYHERLKRYEPELIMAAVNMAIDRCTFFPSIAEIISDIAGITARNTLLLDASRPDRDEAKAVLEALHKLTEELEARDLEVKEKRIADRKAELRRQAEQLGVKR
jgi:hypothetical protein